MASGITHILLSKKLQDEIPDGPLKDMLAFGSDFLTVGSVAPDLPYASIADNDYFLTTEGPLADKFHYEKTNQVTLRALTELKNLRGIREERVHGRMFSFFLGYMAHVGADGIIHPFIRDKVGNYKGHESAHRSLEMQLDVLYLEHLTHNSGFAAELNYTNIHDELLNFAAIRGSEETISLFSQLISGVYSDTYPIKKIAGWIDGLHWLFNVAEGNHLKIYRNLEANTYLFKNREDIDPEKALILTKPVDDQPTNFLHTDRIDYLEEVIPRFFTQYVPLAQKAYEFVFTRGQALDEGDIPAIDLDTGRLISNNDLNLIPEFWK